MLTLAGDGWGETAGRWQRERRVRDTGCEPHHSRMCHTNRYSVGSVPVAAKTHPGITKTSLPVITASMTDVRTGLNAADLRQAVIDHMGYTIGRLPAVATMHDYYQALALAVRDRMQQRWLATTQTYFDLDRKIACYLSAEFLMGPHLGNNLMNLGIEDVARVAMAGLGQDLDAVLACEEEPGLGNGGLGRLAACYLDSLATLQRPAVGYGIRYEFGIFDQEIHDGWQAEVTDKWLRYGNPWEIAKPNIVFTGIWKVATVSAGCRTGW